MIRPALTAAALAGIFALSGCCDKNPDTRSDASSAPAATPAKVNLLVGTYTEGPASSGKSRGIPVFRFDTTTGEAVRIADNDGIRNPSWLTLTPDGRNVFAVNELHGTGQSGEVSSFGFDRKTGKLTFINKVSSGGDDPCHLWWDIAGSQPTRSGEYNMDTFVSGTPRPAVACLYVSNYSAGGMVPLQVNLRGELEPAEQSRPEDPRLPAEPDSHIHSLTQNGFSSGYFVQDLGTDTIHVLYRPGGPTITENSVLRLPSGTGPRHLIFNTHVGRAGINDAQIPFIGRGDRGYLIGELNDTVTVLDASTRHLHVIEILRLGAPVAPGKGTAAAIHLSEDGRFLYASTRNPKNILVVFAVNPTDGTLREIQTVPSGGKAPREFAIAPGGKFLLVANQQSDAIAVFSRDPETGKIADTGRRIEVGTPVDLKWAPAK